MRGPRLRKRRATVSASRVAQVVRVPRVVFSTVVVVGVIRAAEVGDVGVGMARLWRRRKIIRIGYHFDFYIGNHSTMSSCAIIPLVIQSSSGILAKQFRTCSTRGSTKNDFAFEVNLRSILTPDVSRRFLSPELYCAYRST